MATKVYVLFAALLLAGVAMPIANAELPSLVRSLVNISGIVPCSLGGSVPQTTTNVFPNATVQLMCGINVVASTTTNSNGAFSFLISVPTNLTTFLSSLISSLLSGSCRAVVTTPLISCNANLTSVGSLTAPVQNPLGITFISLLSGILNAILPVGMFGLV